MKKNWLAVSYTELQDVSYRNLCHGLFGVALKRKILAITVAELLEAQGDPQSIENTLRKLRQTGALAVLEKGQGFTSRMFPCIQTSAARALENIIEEMKARDVPNLKL